MSSHDWFVEHRAAFVTRSLGSDEERAYREHLTACQRCRDAVVEIERELAWLPMAAGPVTPRPGLTRVMVQSVLTERRPLPRWVVPVSLAASLLLAVGAWAWAIRKVAATEDRLLGQLADTRDTLSIIRQAGTIRHASITMNGQKGGIVLFADDRTHRWNVVVYGLPAPRRGEICQFWFITDQGMIRGVEVKSGGLTPAFMTLPMPNDTSHFMGAAITLEPEGSASTAPQGKQLVHLML